MQGKVLILATPCQKDQEKTGVSPTTKNTRLFQCLDTCQTEMNQATELPSQ